MLDSQGVQQQIYVAGAAAPTPHLSVLDLPPTVQAEGGSALNDGMRWLWISAAMLSASGVVTTMRE
jgi:hypothetical protein